MPTEGLILYIFFPHFTSHDYPKNQKHNSTKPQNKGNNDRKVTILENVATNSQTKTIKEEKKETNLPKWNSFNKSLPKQRRFK